MNLFNFSGDIYGSSCSYSPSIKNHLRPADGDFGFSTIVQPSLLDYVRSNAGKIRNNGFFLPFQLSFTQHTKERTQ